MQMWTTVHAQWLPTSGPAGQIVIEDIFRFNSNDYVSVENCGTFKRASGEDTWRHFSDLRFTSHVIEGDSIFANVLGEGVYSINLTENEFILSRPVLINGDNYTLTKSRSQLYLNEYRVFYRVNFDGTDGERIVEGIPLGEFDDPAPIYSFAVSDEIMISSTGYGVLSSDLDSVYWQQSNNGIEPGYVSMVRSNDGIFYCVQNVRLYASTDNGLNWNVLLQASSEITSIHFDGQEIFIGTEQEGILNSSDLGVTWQQYLNGGSASTIDDIVKLGSERFFINPVDGLFRISEQMWNDENKGLFCSKILSLVTNSDYLYAGGLGVVGYQNSSSVWNDISPTTINRTLRKINNTGDTLFVAVEERINVPPYSEHFIIYSIDRGENWNKIINPESIDHKNRSRQITHQGRLYIWVDNLIFYTEDFGLNWVELNLPADFNTTCIEQMYVNINDLYISTCIKGQILRINQEFEIFETCSTFPSKDIGTLLFNDNYIFAKVFGGFYRGKIREDTWEKLIPLSTDLGSIRGSVALNSTIYISTNKGVFYSTDNAETWIEHNGGLPNLDCTSIAIHNDSLFTGTYGNGVFKRHIASEELTNEIFDSINDIHVYPNPASDYINIWSDKSTNNVVVRVFDLMGKEVLPPSFDSCVIDIQSLLSGTYILSFEINNQYSSQKLIIQR